jgi:hypothetical protein
VAGEIRWGCCGGNTAADGKACTGDVNGIGTNE